MQAVPYERTEGRKGYANGFKDKKVQTRFGQLHLQVPQARGLAFTLLAQNAQHYVPNVAMREEIAQTVRDVYQALNRREAEERLKEAVVKYEKRAPKFSQLFEENGLEGMMFYSRPRGHWKKVRTVNVVERLNEEVKHSG